jgi:AraC-like DNA-binding protein
MPSLKKRRLHLVDVTTMLPVIDRLRTHTSKVERLISKSGLSPDTFEQCDSFIPLHAMVNFTNLAARTMGEQLFGWNCVMNAPRSSDAGLFLGNFGRELTAYESLVKFTKMLNLKSSGGKYWCEAKNDQILLVRSTELNSPVDNWVSEQFVLATYTKMLTEVLGSQVVPITVTLRESVVPAVLPEIFRGCQIIPNQRNTSISVSVSKPYTHKNLTEGFHAPKNDPDTKMSEIKYQLLNMALPENSHGVPSLTSMSEAFGLNARSLQRRLSEYGLSYSEILDEVRFRRCLEALSDPTLSITSIAFEIGYLHAGDFSRAFSRRMGFSPRAYRRQLLDGS